MLTKKYMQIQKLSESLSRVLLSCKPLYVPNVLNIDVSHEVEYE